MDELFVPAGEQHPNESIRIDNPTAVRVVGVVQDVGRRHAPGRRACRCTRRRIGQVGFRTGAVVVDAHTVECRCGRSRTIQRAATVTPRWIPASTVTCEWPSSAAISAALSELASTPSGSRTSQAVARRAEVRLAELVARAVTPPCHDGRLFVLGMTELEALEATPATGGRRTARSPADARLARDAKLRRATASQVIRRAKTLASMPLIADALAEGAINVDHVDLLMHANAQWRFRCTRFAVDEETLVGCIRGVFAQSIDLLAPQMPPTPSRRPRGPSSPSRPYTRLTAVNPPSTTMFAPVT